MILCVGEILCDFIGGSKGTFTRYAGGAPFNVACNIAYAGAESGFIGKVGKDIHGDFLKGFVADSPVRYHNILTDLKRNTTLAFVSLAAGGERDFTFFRHDTADFQMELKELSLDSLLPSINGVHIGSLMLSSEKGRSFANDLVAFCKKNRLPISFDVNFRSDIFKNKSEAIRAYTPMMECADILKFSEEEVTFFAGVKDIAAALRSFARPGRVAVVTLGKKGAMYCMNKKMDTIPAKEVKAVDTTGAGDAFFGALLSRIVPNYTKLTEASLRNAITYANSIGAYAVTKKGAINPFPN